MDRREALRNLSFALGGSLVAGGASGASVLGQEAPAAPKKVSKFGSLNKEALVLKERAQLSTAAKRRLEVLKPQQGFLTDLQESRNLGIRNPIAAVRSRGRGGSSLFLDSEKGVLNKNALENQFIAYQVMQSNSGIVATLPTRVSPVLSTPETTPDVLLSAKLLSFHLAENSEINKPTRATMRLTFGGDDGTPRGRDFENVKWAIITGLQLYDRFNDRKLTRLDSSKFETDLSSAFANRPIEIPGGYGVLNFEVIKHNEPSWWRKTLKWFISDEGKLLTSSIGFPGITDVALGIVDEVFSRFDKGGDQKLLISQPLKFAFSKEPKAAAAPDIFSSRTFINVSSLNPGFWILASRAAIPVLHGKPIQYFPNYGLLAPAAISHESVTSGNYVDPFKDITYAVVRVGMKATKLEKSLL